MLVIYRTALRPWDVEDDFALDLIRVIVRGQFRHSGTLAVL